MEKNADDFINFLVSNYIDKDEYILEKKEENKKIEYYIKVKKRSLGKVLGKGGKVAEAIRELAKSLPNVQKRIYIKFDQMDENE